MTGPTRLMPFLLLVCTAAFAQGVPGGPPPPGAPPGPPPQVVQPGAPELPPELVATRQFLEEGGMPREQATLFALLLNNTGDDMASMLPMLMMMGQNGGGGGDMGGLIFMMMLNKMSSAGKAAPFGYWHDDQGRMVYIIEDGWLYEISLANNPIAVTRKVQYRAPKQGGGALAVLQTLAPQLAQAREKALTTACASNLKQLALGFLMYAQDHGGLFPHANWAAEIMPYIKNEAILSCPARQGTGLIGYAMNRQLIQADLKALQRPAETVLLFEVGVDLPDQVGGPDDIPPGGVHEGMVNAAYADGHVKLISVEDAKRQLAQ